MVIGNCDLISEWESGGIGGMVIAIAWALWSWWRHKTQSDAGIARR